MIVKTVITTKQKSYGFNRKKTLQTNLNYEQKEKPPIYKDVDSLFKYEDFKENFLNLCSKDYRI